MLPTIAKNSLRCLLLILIPFTLFSEGIKELRPDSTASSADLFLTHGYAMGDYFTDFGMMDCSSNYRLYIHVKNAGESILFGLNTNNFSIHFNLKKPDGTIALTGSCPVSGQAGHIDYYSQAKKGPFPAMGGYLPLEYHVSSISDTGNYYFEISDLPVSDYMDISLWDFQVVSGIHSPALPADTINGRVWSQSWQFDADLSTTRLFNGRFYIFSDDGIVTKLKFTNARVGVVTLFCNPTGCYNTGNPLYDRKSWPTNTFSTFPGIAQYKVFLNNPDTTVYVSGVYGAITSPPLLIPDPAYPPCSGEKQVAVDVSKAGTSEVDLFFPYGAPSTNVALYSSLLTGTNYIPWNGLDGLGNPVPDGTTVTLRVIYMNGLTNLPIWDQEQNPNGYQVTLVRPVNPAYPAPLTFWDDSNISGYLCPGGTNLTGCVPYPSGCHTWSGFDCHDKTINTWWYGNSDTATGSYYYTRTPPEVVGHDSTRCGPGSVTLHATVPFPETVDWYDTISGGIPLLTGDTTFVTPVLSQTKAYYAETRNDSSGCTSAIRTPVLAIIRTIPVPTLAGPLNVCDSSQDNIYVTDPFMTNYSWTVSPGGTITSGSGTDSIFVTWLFPGTQLVSVNYTDTNGCTGSQPTLVNVLVTPKPDSAGPVSGLQEICAGTNGVLYFIAPVPYGTYYTWTVPPGAIIVAGAGTDSITVNFPPNALSGNFTVYASDSCGPGVPSPPYPVIIYQPPAANAGPDDSVCQDHPYQVSLAMALNYVSLLWTSNGQGSLEGNTTLSPTYSPAPGETGPVILTLTATGEPSCGNDTSRMTLRIQPGPIADAGKEMFTCGRIPVILSGSSASHYSSLFWKTMGSGIFDEPDSLHPSYTPGYSDSLQGHVLLKLIVLGSTLCPVSMDSVILQIAAPAIIFAGHDDTVCEGRSYQVTGTFAWNYESLRWTTGGSGLFDDPQKLKPVYTPGRDDVLKGFVILTLHATPVFPCLPGADSMKLSILKAPVVSAGPGAITCETLPVTITGASATGYDSLYWTHTGQGSLIGERTLTPTYLPGAGETGIILLTLTAYGKDACSDSMATALTEITIYPAITIDAGQDRLIPYGTKDTLSGSVNGGSGIFRYKWEPASLLTDSTSLNPVTIVLTADTNFILSVTDYLTGCLATDTVRIRIRKQPVNESDCIVIHNVITPNGDGLNDTWIIDCIENFPDNKVEIFNQWGVMVKSFTHYDNSTQVWKGTNFNDKPVPDATYFYVLTIKDQEPRMGWIFVRDGSR